MVTDPHTYNFCTRMNTLLFDYYKPITLNNTKGCSDKVFKHEIGSNIIPYDLPYELSYLKINSDSDIISSIYNATTWEKITGLSVLPLSFLK